MNTDFTILHARILVVDDLESNVKLLVTILVSAGYTTVSFTCNPRDVRELHRTNRYDLILLDLQMPALSGFEVMAELKGIAPEDYLPVLVITAQPELKLHALQAGARDFIGKPFEMAEILVRVHNMLEVRLLERKLRQFNDRLERTVEERTAKLQESYLETIFAMTRAAEHKDEETGAHLKRVSYYSREMARVLGMDAEFVDRIFVASPMHDIGKIGIPDNVLLKPGSLTPGEWLIMKTHTTIGARILGSSSSPYLIMGAEIALHHHERWDGRGYPRGTRGLGIPLTARIMNVGDVYDALRSKRPYKPAFDHRTTVEIMTHGDGRTHPEHFDPDLLAVFARTHESFRDIFETAAE